MGLDGVLERLSKGKINEPKENREDRMRLLFRITKGTNMKYFGLTAALVLACLLIAPVVKISSAAGNAKPATGPTKENALEAAKELAQAMRTNDADGLCRLLDPDWAVVTGLGDIDEGDAMGDGKMKESLCAAIKTGTFARETYDMDFAHARVRFYGNIATVTANLSVSGSLNHKWFAVKEVQTDVLKWEDGGWKSVLTHETNVKDTLRTDKDSSK
jgi:ketosteroid isomerase-like protein